MGLNILGLCIMDKKLCLECELPKMVLYFTGNGRIMLEMAGVYSKTKKLDIDMLGSGKKIVNGGMAVKVA